MARHRPEAGHVDNTTPGGSAADQEASERLARIKRDSFAVPPVSIERPPQTQYKTR